MSRQSQNETSELRQALIAGLLAFAAIACGTWPSAAQAQAARQYRLDYTAEFMPARKGARVSLAALPDEGRLKVLDFYMPASRYIDIRGDGRITRNGDRVLWVIPRKGGTLVYFHLIDHRRPSGAYDARITSNWAIVRGDNLFPAAITTATRNSDARARLHFKLPKGWNGVETPYLPTRKPGGGLVVVNSGRSFDRPTGWIVAGKVGTRREHIDGTSVVVSSPTGQGMRRMDIMAMVHWHLREMDSAFAGLPRKILIAGAGDPMWRGGLSGPRSLWMHSDRPLISENGTSSLLHELSHVVTGLTGADGADWIAEGIAEFYSIEFMRRAGTISRHRYDRAMDGLRKRSADIRVLRTSRSTGAVTARAVLLFAALDAEIRKRTANKKRLDHVVRLLRVENRVGLAELRKAAREVIGKDSTTLAASPLLH
ncbi:MAG: hypothetical protein ABIP49_06340 [Lysobacterales bacterium]